MTERTKQHLDQAIANSRFDIGHYFGKGFEFWKEQAGLYISFMLVSMVISFIAGLIPFIGPIAYQLVISPLLIAGGLIFTHQIATKGRPEFKHFFDGVEHAGTIIGVYALMGLLSIAIIAPFILLGYFNMDTFTSEDPMMIYEMMSTLLPLFLILFIVFLLVYMFFAHVIHFIVFYRLGVMDSIRYSSKLFLKHPFMFIVYFILLGLLMMSGLVGLIVCVFLTITFVYPMTYAPFRYLTDLDGFENNDETNDVVNTLVTF
jgi:hypothetical protein